MKRRITTLIGIVPFLSSCQHYITFGTATTMGLDVSKKPDQSVNIGFGYERYEMAVLPGPANPDATENGDAYAVLGTIEMDVDTNPFNGSDTGMHIGQRFATGEAARLLAEDESVGRLMGEVARKTVDTKDAKKEDAK